MNETWLIKIEGRIQGVGFRPFIYTLARKMKLKGTVRNTLEGVEIEIGTDKTGLHNFLKAMEEQIPSIARIDKIASALIEQKDFPDFEILNSQLGENPTLDITPDFGTCPQCKAEIGSAEDRRFHYAFTTCTFCGPRYSIISKLPYDRERTSMIDFNMCDKCVGEYLDHQDRRFHSQTSSCSDCSIDLQLISNHLTDERSKDPIVQVVELWQKSGVIMIKGLGGYLLTCAANNIEAISRLRQIKKRPYKPLAIICGDVDFVKMHFNISDQEEMVLCSPVVPIVLLRPKNPEIWAMGYICPGLTRIGVMLPSTPLLHLLTDQFQAPVIATSANITNSPIYYRDEQVLTQSDHLGDAILSYNRDIVVPQDDSVIQFSTYKKQSIILRRSRGMAPEGLQLRTTSLPKDLTILAMGADLKSSFAYLNQGKMYVSQYLGDLSHFDTRQRFELVLEHFLKLFGKNPDVILADNHPDYQSTQLGHEYAEKFKIPIHFFQHHKAHFGAIMMEHELEKGDKVLGVCWDGTGFGDDEQFWGGEFFLQDGGGIQRVGHLAYYDHLAGNKMPAEPRLSALSLIHNHHPKGLDELKGKFTELQLRNYHTLLTNNQLKTSSVGRFFDAVASILNLSDRNHFEGQASILLEERGSAFQASSSLDGHDLYEIAIDSSGQLNPGPLLAGIMDDLYQDISISEIAFKFHQSLATWVKQMAEKCNCKKLAFSGGVFQNALLVDLIIEHLKGDYQLYFHHQLSPNDENIAVGQLNLYLNTIG